VETAEIRQAFLKRQVRLVQKRGLAAFAQLAIATNRKAHDFRARVESS